jgi:uracil-DNA glycosylase
MSVQIEKSWEKVLGEELTKEYFLKLWRAVGKAYGSEAIQVFPPQALIFNAFEHCHFEDVKVVILGQDPYHGAGQAHGLSFSVPEGVKIPPSLRNIHTELNSNVNITISGSGNLERWAGQGVLLLNSVLTVEEGNPGSHQSLGWETFTDAAIQKISDNKENVVFLLWGKYAQEKGKSIDTTKHLVLTAPHPSPLSAYKGFLGCAHFNKVNQYLKKHSLKLVDW